MNTKKLIKNAIKCLKCNDVVESKHKHRFKWCDGGTSYIRLVGDLDIYPD